MPQLDQLHTIEIPYPPYETKRSLTCISVNNFEDYEPVDFREFLPAEIAEEEFKICAVGAARSVLKMREESFGKTQAVPNMGRIGAHLGNIAVRPFGKLSYVNDLRLFDQDITVPGVTSTMHRQSFIIESNIHSPDDKAGHRSASVLLSKDAFVESAAVHELIHLAGIPDILYFIADRKTQRAIRNMKFSPLALEQAARIDRGGLFEEGFATLGAYMYLWQRYPEVISDTRTEPRRSPNGFEVDLPVRHALYTNAYAYAAWAMERLTDPSPRIWSIFQSSRVYGADPEKVRGALKTEINKLDDKLFAYLDSVDVKHLTQVMQASAVVNVLVGRAIGEGR